jgi:DNA-binding transcriptional MerR regulator
MAPRLHLTIGEVLSLLREEFPDVSISKIRFLESQGLVEPERTPSGYRKFYEHDVDRLRWILRQQREHFLPLKVIRGRLTGQEGDDPTGSSRLVAVEGVVVEGVVVEGVVVEGVVVERVVVEGVVVDEAVGEDAGRDLAPATAVGDAPAMNGAEIFGDAVAPENLEQDDRSGSADGPPPADRLFGPDGPREEEAAPAPVQPESVLADPVHADPVHADPVVAAPAFEDPRIEEDGPEEDGDGAEQDGLEEKGHEEKGAEDPVHEEPKLEGTTVQDASQEEPAAPEPSPASAAAPDIYSVAEVAEAVGCTPQLIRELQQFGILVAASDVGGKMYFEPDAVGLARVGARFAELGVEPRHLRTWRNAADREASLFEQLVMPLLRQRNPQSRRQAAERLDELSTLGSQLRAGLLAEAVRGIK